MLEQGQAKPQVREPTVYEEAAEITVLAAIIHQYPRPAEVAILSVVQRKICAFKCGGVLPAK